MKNILDLHQLDVTFKMNVHAVKGVSFSIAQGEILGLVGESGSGKSATARALMGLISKKDHMISCRADFCGKPFDPEISRGVDVAMVFQNPMTSLNPTMQVGKQITEGICFHQKISSSAARTQAIALLENVGIRNPTKRFHDYPHQLSGGMRQRVVIAIALALEPRLLIADEPTTALDATIQVQILDLLKQVRDRGKMGMLFLSHDLGVVAHICDRVAVMYQGKIVEIQTVQEIFKNPQHPYTKQLMELRL